MKCFRLIFFGPLPRSIGGVQYLFVLQDVFSKLVTLYPIKRSMTQICLNKLTSYYFEKIGKPRKILSDHVFSLIIRLVT